MKNKENRSEKFFGIMIKVNFILAFAVYCLLIGGFYYGVGAFFTGLSWYGIWYYDQNIKDKK